MPLAIEEHAGLAEIFEQARTHKAWQSREIPEALLHRLYDRLRWAPTSANTNPGRFVFISSAAAKERLKPFLAPQNVEKTMTASVCVIVAVDTSFVDHLQELSPARDIRPMFINSPAMTEETANRNAILQGAYLIIAARTLGLDCGPMSGFDRTKLDGEFFPDGRWHSDFLINLGYGDSAALPPRGPRLAFGQACQIL